jgi:hypothetical protein
MMMRMLEQGGLPVLTDGIRTANEDNPRGYYEFERVKKLPEGDTAWLPEAEGKAVKVIAALLMHLPPSHTYRVLFMRRSMAEILASQKRMLANRGEVTDAIDDEEMSRLFEKHLDQVFDWIDKQPNVTTIDVNYNELLVTPREALADVVSFLDLPLDLDRMVAVADPALYRQRADRAGEDAARDSRQ